ncbi:MULTISPECIES: hypothetical protein [unclassified Mycobacterium]|uniref:hypothetical protein n=1 Tax=unclassified Mycobacterium TaxID=2642494 RepID=UPI0009947BE7|nr:MULTISPECIES: hypothetical protein [unclassified Mycobacterium]
MDWRFGDDATHERMAMWFNETGKKRPRSGVDYLDTRQRRGALLAARALLPAEWSRSWPSHKYLVKGAMTWGNAHVSPVWTTTTLNPEPPCLPRCWRLVRVCDRIRVYSVTRKRDNQ